MNYLWVIYSVGIVTSILYLRLIYVSGTKKAFKRCLSILVPILLSGTATRIGALILPDFILLSYYIAGVGTLIFYTILAPIFQKNESDRYRRISKESKILAVAIGMINIWLFLSFAFFFINLLNYSIASQKILDIILVPIRILWLFPNF